MRKKQSKVAASYYLFLKLLRSMKIILFLLLAFVIQVNAKAYSQQRVSLEYENVELSKVMKSLERQTNLYFFFNDKALDTKQRVSVSVENEDLESVLQRLFGDVYDWEIVNNMIVLKPNVNQDSGTQQQQLKERKVNGIVKDRRGEPLPGVAVVLKGTTVGTATDIDGKYTLTLPEGNYTLVFSMLGMKVREELVGDRTEIDVVMEEDAAEMDEVVVTGIFKKARESYTGAVSTITREELQVHRGQNLLQTLKNVDVSLNFRANNAVGSNPNARPQINIRGNSSLPNLDALNEEASNTVNEPLVIMDGFEISLDRLMDYNDEEIESINILKDAAATAIYGSRGSNGVIVITTREPEPGKLRINAEVGIDLEVPDLTSYDLLNAKEKLELEYSLGLYNNTSNPEYDVAYKDLYNQRYRNVQAGATTDWIDKPIRTGVGSHYNLRLEGGSDQFRWSATANYKNVAGAMKNSYRRTFNGGITLMYTIKDLTFKNYLSYGIQRGEESNYGSFGDYVIQQPWQSPYDENGNVLEFFESFYGWTAGTGERNPLYDATLKSPRPTIIAIITCLQIILILLLTTNRSIPLTKVFSVAGVIPKDWARATVIAAMPPFHIVMCLLKNTNCMWAWIIP